MIPLFLGLTLVNLLCLGSATALGYMSLATPASPRACTSSPARWRRWCACGVHCVVFTYFIATAKWVQHAVLVKQLDPSLAAPTRCFKMQAFPAALLAMAVVFATAILGARAETTASRGRGIMPSPSRRCSSTSSSPPSSTARSRATGG